MNYADFGPRLGFAWDPFGTARTALRGGLAVNYTWSRALDSTSGSPQDVYDIERDYGLSSIHRAHVFNANFIYELPFFRHRPSALLRQVLSGWDVAGIFIDQSGAPFTVTVPTDTARIGVNSSRASLVGDPSLPGGQRTPEAWFNTSALLPPGAMTPGQFGDSPRNVLIGPRFVKAELDSAFGSQRSQVSHGHQTNSRLDTPTASGGDAGRIPSFDPPMTGMPRQVDRLTATTQRQRNIDQQVYSIDFNERCPNVGYLLDFLRRLKAQTPRGFDRVQYIEQPTARDRKRIART